jgi:predicted dehydrogenase
MQIDRRSFWGAAALGGVRILGANDRINCAMIGMGGRGTYLTGQFRAHGAEITAVCDVYETRLEAGAKAASAGAKLFVDYRLMLEDKSIDAVIIATPDHQHAQMLIDAVDAGKDVYVEKPLAHTVEDGFRMIGAVRRTKRVAQIGTQRRSYPLYQEAKRILDSGAAGEIRLVNAWWTNYWDSLSTAQLQGKLHWELFLGPAPKRPLNAFRYFNWLQFYDYSGGIVIGQAAHIVDGVQWMMNSSYPLAVTCSGVKMQHLRRIPRELLTGVHYRLQGDALPDVQRPNAAVPRRESPFRFRARILRPLSSNQQRGCEGEHGAARTRYVRIGQWRAHRAFSGMPARP